MTAFLRNTPCGPIRGTTCQWSGVESYRGIRYATAGRWEYPSEVTAWEGEYDATSYGNCSYQPRAFYKEEDMPEKAFYYNEFRKGETYSYSEDCLFLNIWTPETADETSRLPVIFYIHGGGFTGGCGHEKHFDGPIWPALSSRAVAVTINYRLGPMGFAALPELAEEAGHTGNYGLYDQMTALLWVKHNIKGFGGDPDNITIMGQSAGAMSVQQHCMSRLTEGLFQKAVLSSGGGVSGMMKTKKAEDTYAFWQTVMANAGCETLEEFRALEPEALFDCWTQTKKEIKGGGMSCAPVQDGTLIDGNGADLQKQGRIHKVPYIIGSNSEDIVPPLIYNMAKSFTKKQAAPECPVWQYFFERNLPGDNCGAWHSADLWYWFGTLEHCWRPLTARDQEISREMANYLVNFAATGNPNGKNLPVWKAGAAPELHFSNGQTKMGKVNMLKLVKTMLSNKAVGE